MHARRERGLPDQSARTCRGSLRTPQRCAGWGGPSAAGGRREEDERLWGPAARPVGQRASRTEPCPRWETSCARSVKPTMPLYDSFFLLFLVRPFLFSLSVSSLPLPLPPPSLDLRLSVSLSVLSISISLCLSLSVLSPSLPPSLLPNDGLFFDRLTLLASSS